MTDFNLVNCQCLTESFLSNIKIDLKNSNDGSEFNFKFEQVKTNGPGNTFCFQREALHRNTKQLLKDMFCHNPFHRQFIEIELDDPLYKAKLQVVKFVSCFLNVYLVLTHDLDEKY